MSSSRHSGFLVFAGMALLVIGYVTGRFFPPRISRPEMSASRAPSPSSQRNSPGSSRPAAVPDRFSSSSFDDGDWTASWARLSSQPHSPAVDEAAAAALQKLAETDPARALAIALQERNQTRRTGWLHAALRGWATVAPDAAAAWVVTLPSLEHEGAEGAVMDGAALHPAAAVSLAQRLIQADPAGGRLHANQLLRSLNHRGDYEASVDFAARLPEEIRAEMLGTAFQYWAQAQPERALDVAMKLPESDARKTALDAAISGWAQADPSSLAEFGLDLSSREDRTEVLQTALREWVQVNPKAASDWIVRFDPKPELDAGAAAVALSPDLLAQQPEMAVRWAENITQPGLRSSTLANVLREWAAKDATAALRYAKSSGALQPADRAALIEALNSRD